MLRMVHAADIHLDTPYRRHDEAVRARLLEAGREAFTRLIDLALERQADALLIAGDLFDNDWLTLATERVLVDELTRATSAGVTVVYATGNHDPGRANYRAMGIEWPAERFHLVASRQPRQIAIERAGEVVGWVVAAGHQTPREDRDLAAAFPRAPGPEPAVGLLHAQVVGAAAVEQHHSYAPTSLDSLGPQLCLLGAGSHPPAPGSAGRSAGSLCGQRAGPAIRRGGRQGGVGGDAGSRRRARDRVSGAGAGALGDAGAGRARGGAHRGGREGRGGGGFRRSPERGAARPGVDSARGLARSLSAGASLLASGDERTELAVQLREDLDVLDVEVRDRGLHRPLDLDAHRDQPHLLGQTLALLARAATDDTELDRITPSELAGAEAGDATERRAYLRELLQDLDAEAAERLLRDSGRHEA